MAAKEVLLTKAAIRVDDRDQAARATARTFGVPLRTTPPRPPQAIEGLDDLDGFESSPT